MDPFFSGEKEVPQICKEMSNCAQTLSISGLMMPSETKLLWSAMSPFYQYAAIDTFTKGMSKAAAEVMYMAIEACDPEIVFSDDFLQCKISDDSAPKVREFIEAYLKRDGGKANH